MESISSGCLDPSRQERFCFGRTAHFSGKLYLDSDDAGCANLVAGCDNRRALQAGYTPPSALRFAAKKKPRLCGGASDWMGPRVGSPAGLLPQPATARPPVSLGGFQAPCTVRLEEWSPGARRANCYSACKIGADSISMKFADGVALFSERNQHDANQFPDFRPRPRRSDCRKYHPLDDAILVTARAGIQVATCPLCGSPSRRVHSRYVREVSDLPCSGRSVRLRIVARGFCCSTPRCRRRIFAERFDKTVLLVRSRRTNRLDSVVHHLGLALGGRPAASFAKRLMLPVTMIRFSAWCEPGPARGLSR
jgi:hypothetical protein